jgi:hypothetical protein
MNLNISSMYMGRKLSNNARWREEFSLKITQREQMKTHHQKYCIVCRGDEI